MKRIPLSDAENTALDRMVQKLPVKHRAKARAVLAEKIEAGHYLRVKDNPDLQRLLEEVYNERGKAHRGSK